MAESKAAGMVAELINLEQSRWQVLDGWKILYSGPDNPYCDPDDPENPHVNQCSHSAETKRAIIAPWDGRPLEIVDYIIHEVIHCALAAARLDSEAEELLVQDLTGLVLRAPFTIPD